MTASRSGRRLLLLTAPGLTLAVVSLSADWIGMGRIGSGFGRTQLVILLFAIVLTCSGMLMHCKAMRDSARRDYWKTVCFLVALFTVFIGSGIVLAEGVCHLCSVRLIDYRRIDSTLGWSLEPDRVFHVKSVAKSFDVVVRIDKQGFRDDGQEIKSVDQCGVVVIGDSNAFGFGLAENETLSHRLYQDFSSRGYKLNVLNAGVPGYGLGQFYLRLKTLGKLRAGAVVVVLVHPANDLRNASCNVDYGLSKPNAHLEHGILEFRDDLARGRIEEPYHFSALFEALNNVFQMSVPKPLWTGIVPATLEALRGERIFHLKGQASKDPVIMSDMRLGEKYREDVLDGIRRQPLTKALPFWTEIRQFERERSKLGLLAERLLAEMAAHVEANGQELLVVVAPEAYDKQEYYHWKMRHIKAHCPQFTFEFGMSRALVESALHKCAIPFIMVEYGSEQTEQMFIGNDGHTSGAAFRQISQLVVERIVREGWLAQNEPLAFQRITTFFNPRRLSEDQ